MSIIQLFSVPWFVGAIASMTVGMVVRRVMNACGGAIQGGNGR